MDWKDDGKLVIAMPMEGAKMMLLNVGEQYNMFFYTPAGLYYGIAQVSARYRSGSLFMAEMECTSEIEKFQRRQFFRLDCIVDMNYRLVLRQGQQMQGERKPAAITEISGGGTRFKAGEGFSPGDELLVDFALTAGGRLEKFGLRAKVVSAARVPGKEKTYENRVEFVDISEADQEAIVKYIFEEERRRRKKESGMR